MFIDGNKYNNFSMNFSSSRYIWFRIAKIMSKKLKFLIKIISIKINRGKCDIVFHTLV